MLLSDFRKAWFVYRAAFPRGGVDNAIDGQIRRDSLDRSKYECPVSAAVAR